MKRNRRIIVLLIALLIAAAAAAVGVLKILDKRAGDTAGQTATETAEQAGEAQTEKDTGQADPENGDAAQEDPGISEVKPGDGKKEPLATLFFASDFQVEPGFDEPSVTLTKILKTAETDGRSIDRVVICGDYTNDRQLYDYQLSPDESIEEIKAVVAAECPSISEGADAGAGNEQGDGGMLFVQGNHDRLTEEISATGLHEFENYLIYVVNTEEDFPWKQGKTGGCLAKVRASSAAMKECFDGLIRKGEKRPVFIAGHVPLHFTARTSSRHTTGDNLYSSLIFDVVNEAGKSLDIVYLVGHNHSKGWDCYMGGSTVYKAKGDTILIPRFDEDYVNTDEYSQETLAFTYMNAGYLGYYMNCGTEELDAGTTDQYHAADETLTGTVFEIYPDRIVATRYDADGVHVLGHAGEADPYKGGIDAGLIGEDAYSRETRSPQEIPRG